MIRLLKLTVFFQAMQKKLLWKNSILKKMEFMIKK